MSHPIISLIPSQAPGVSQTTEHARATAHLVVPRRDRLRVVECPSSTTLSNAPHQPVSTVQRDLSSRRIVIGRVPDAVIRRSGTAETTSPGAPQIHIPAPGRPALRVMPMRTLAAVAESCLGADTAPSSTAPEAIATATRMWITSQPGTTERAAASALIATTRANRSIEQRGANHVIPSEQTGAGGVALAIGAAGVRCAITSMRRHGAGRLIELRKGARTPVGQIERRSYRLADNVRSMRRTHLRIATRDGVIDAEERALDEALNRLGDELEQKADDERAAIALIRTGRTKHTRGIVVDLFPSIGPEAA